MRRKVVGLLLVTALASYGAPGCGGRAGPRNEVGDDGGPRDGGAASDGAVVHHDGGGAKDAAAIATGQPCDLDGGCASSYTCWLQPPGGYCLYGPPHSCQDSSECPTGTLCSPLPMSQISGVCLLACGSSDECRAGYTCDFVYLFPGEPNSPRSPGLVCWTAPVCTYGQDQTCNDNPYVSSIYGYCQPDGTCICKAGYALNPATGKCR